MDNLYGIILLLTLGGLLVLIYRSFKQSGGADKSILQDELQKNRMELTQSLQLNREELSKNLDRLSEKLEERLRYINENQVKSAKDDREELHKSLKYFNESFVQSVKDFNELQKEKFAAMAVKQDELVKSTELKLEKMRETVDEKLHKTLEERLGKSFEIVTKQLLDVQKGLGEMQTLAAGVGDLKKVLSNVKSRGGVGETQLAMLLESILAPDQYESNVKTKSGSDSIVEFAIKLPGQDNNKSYVYLPIDAKFPQEDYARLQIAYDTADPVAIELSLKALTNSIKKFAKDISSKYIDPPNTTDFGIMFLPFEGLYAEVVRSPDLMAQLQREFKIVVTGPTTLAALLNSLQMGFQTLAIQKRSSEVWQILRSVKTEFGKFGEVLEKTQKKLREADRELDNLVTTRTKMMFSKLNKVDVLQQPEEDNLLE
jgi:DNA recombination protein RmuC